MGERHMMTIELIRAELCFSSRPVLEVVGGSGRTSQL
jgi:hypothetical protein